MITDLVEADLELAHPRALIWELISNPEWYPRFFRGLGICEKVADATKNGPAIYTFQTRLHGMVMNHHMRVIPGHADEGLLIEGVQFHSLVSIRLGEAKRKRTRVVITFFKPALVHPALAEGKYMNAAIVEWAREGLTRMDEYLSEAPTSVVENNGEAASLQVSIAKLMVGVGVVRVPPRPDRGLRQLHSLAKWGFTLAGGYGAAAARAPQVPALADERGSWSFSEINSRTTRLAAALHALGLDDTTPVGVLARNHCGLVETMVACGRLGCDLVLLNTGMSAPQISDVVARHRLAAIVLDDEFERVVRQLPLTIRRISSAPSTTMHDRPTLGELILDAPARCPRPTEPGRQIVLTSGTTGVPKSAHRPTPKGFGTIASVLSRMPLQMGEPMMIAAPLFHTWGLAALQISTPLRAKVVLQDRFDAESCLRAIAAHRCTSLFAAPVMLQRIMDLPAHVRARYDTSSLKVVAVSGSAPSAQLVTDFMDAYGDVLYSFYGSTEVSWATVADPADLRAAPATAGYPPLGTTVRILGCGDKVLPRGAVGRIFVGNDMLFDGYAGVAAPKMVDSLMETGDLGYVDADGRLFVIGRDDEMVISGGENVYPRPVEEALSHLPMVRDVAVVGVPDHEFGQRLAAFVVPADGARMDPETIRNFVNHRLSRFAVPRDVVFLNALPRNATGKVLKAQLGTM